MPHEQPSPRPVAVPEETRSSQEWGEVLEKAPDRVQAINAGRTKAIERAIGAEMSFNPEIATVSSTNELQSALTCTVAPMEGDTSMWSRVTAAADLAFGARAMLRLRVNDEQHPVERPNSTIHTIITEKINVVPTENRINPSLPVVMEEVANPDSESQKEGVIRFICRQNGVQVGTVEVAYRYAAQRALRNSAIPSRNKQLAEQSKDAALPPARDITDLTTVLGIDLHLTEQERKQGFDAKYAPYPHCLNYWGSAHGSALVAFATFGVPGIENGFDVSYPGAAIPEFPADNSEAASTKVFYRKREENSVGVYDEDGKLLVRVEFTEPSPKISDPDADMVVQMKSNDQDAWEEFERRYGKKLRSTMMRHLPQGAEIDAEYAEFRMQLWRVKLASFDPVRGLFSHWLQRCLTYHIIDRVRSMRRQAPVYSLDAPLIEGRKEGATFAESLEGYNDPEQVLLREEFGSRVREALSKLDEKKRVPIEKVYMEGMSYADAAESLGLSVGKIKSRINKGKIELKRRLQQQRKAGRL